MSGAPQALAHAVATTRAAGLPPRPRGKPETAVGQQPAAVNGSSPPGTPAASAAGGAVATLQPLPSSQHVPPSLPRPASTGSDLDQPFTFTSPFTAAAELRRGQGGAAQPPLPPQTSDSSELEGGSPRPNSVLRTSSGSMRGGEAGRMRRNVSWTDFEHQAPLAQVVEYEPSEGRSARSEEEWGRQSGCLCCVQ